MNSRNLFCRCMGFMLAVMLAGIPTLSLAQTPTSAPTLPSQRGQQDASGKSAEGAVAVLPDSPGAVLQQIAQAQAAQTPESGNAAQAPEANQQQPRPQVENPSQTQAPTKQPASQEQEPVGTAAAGVSNGGGVTASEPAGAALAPAKQRRTRGLLIKVGTLVGAGVAVGTVMALSKGSPSKPPGSQ